MRREIEYNIKSKKFIDCRIIYDHKVQINRFIDDHCFMR